MSFYEDRLSDPWIRDKYMGAGRLSVYEREVDYEDGPIHEQDTSQGGSYQEWRGWVEDGGIWLEAPNTPKRLVYQSGGEITDLSVAFNQNGDLHYTYVEDGQAKMYWFNTLTSQFETMDLPTGSRTPIITLDEKRATQRELSDLILSYIGPDHGLYFRKQRERFQVERQLHPGPFVMLRQVYMNRGWRLQWLVTPGLPIL